MPKSVKLARVCQSIVKNLKQCKSMQKYLKVLNSMQKCKQQYQSMTFGATACIMNKYVWKRMQKITKVFTCITV